MHIARMSLLCAAAMMAALPAVSVAGEESPLSLSNRSLSVAMVAKEELVRHIPHIAHQDFNIRVYDNVTQYDVFIHYGWSGQRCMTGVPNICGEGCGRCFHVVVGADLKVIGSDWDYNSKLETEDVPESVLNGLVLPF